MESDAVMVGIWTRSGEQGGKGKGKDVEVDEGNDMKGWKLLEEVRIELCSLISIGQDVRPLPHSLDGKLISSDSADRVPTSPSQHPDLPTVRQRILHPTRLAPNIRRRRRFVGRRKSIRSGSFLASRSAKKIWCRG